MVPRPILVVLVFALPILVVTFAVLLGAAQLAQAMDDAGGSRALFWIAMAALLLLVIDAVLLLGMLGIRALGSEDRDEEPHE